jgi:formylglycine-generating enzyme required for sulfatase activity
MAMAAVIGGALLAVGIGLYRGVYLPRERARQQRTSTPPFRMDANRWAWIPPGTFTMGSPAMDLDRADDEGPQTAVTLTEGFWMGKYEVTQGEYRAVVADNPSRFRDPNRPVEQVTWSDATNYCATLTAQERSAGRLPAGWAYRLPTEAEWEYAARAGTTTTLSYGNDSRYKQLEKYAWYYANSGGTTHPVGQKRPNPWGLYDMSGNVWEWCWDWFGTYLGGSLSDPTGPGSGSDRVLRGGGWLVVEQGCRSAFRVRNSPGLRNSYTGFRAVLALGTNGVPAALAGEPPFLEGAVTNVTSPSVPSTQRAGNTAAVETVTGQPGRESAPPDTPPFNMDTIRWAWMPPGTFTMGSPASEQERDRDEGPQTVVTLTKGFWMGRCEVTQGEYFAVTGSNPSYFKGDQNRPVEDVSWIEATNYCATLTAQERAAARLPTGWAYRLPTEAEWEYAARAETTTRLSYGDDPGYSQLSTHGWYSSNSGSTTHPVGEKRANPWGLYDMSGNVWEWCWDWFGTYHGGSVSNPTGPRSGSNRVVRGGSWYYVEKYCRSASRDFNTPDDRSNRIGFRAVLAAGQP